MDQVNVEIIEPEKWWKPTKYRLSKPVTICGYEAEEGFVTDGATVPRWLALFGAILVAIGALADQWISEALGVVLMMGVVWFPPVGRYVKAAIIHDNLLVKDPENRHSADIAFLEVMKALQIARWRRTIMFVFVWIWSEIVMRWRKAWALTQI